MFVDGQTDRAFADFEKAAWVTMSPHYDALAGQMTRQAVGPILDAVAVRRGDVLLDIATGPGYVAAAAEQRGARVAGVDFSPDMIAGARRSWPALKFDEGDAEDLTYEDASFDIAVCAFGMLHFPRPGKAVAQAWRVLRPRGRFAFTVWCGPAKTKLFGAIGDIMQKYADVGVAQLPPGPGAFMLSDPLVCTALLDAAGFTDVRVEEIPCHFALDAPDGLLEFLRKCSPRAFYIYERQSAKIRATIEQALREAGARVATQYEGRVPCPVLLACGRKVRS